MKRIFALGFLAALAFSVHREAKAFTLIEIGGACKPELAMICAAPPNAEVAECCKCIKPCVDLAGGGSVVNMAFFNCVSKKEKCPTDCPPPPIPDECKVDADCDDKDPCTDDKCQRIAIDGICPDGKKWGAIVGKCWHSPPNPNCAPKGCEEKYANPNEQKCCKLGYDPVVFPELADAFKCCVTNLGAGKKPGEPCCPECPPPPPQLKCDDIVDLKSRECCTKNGGIPLLVIDNCYDSAEKCKNELTIIVGGDFTNTGCIQQCCDIKAGGDVSACNCMLDCPPGTPTTPSGTPPPALGTCAVTPATSDVIAGKEFAFGKDWIVSYTPPSGVGPIAAALLTKVEGVEITVDDPADAATGGWIKTIADPASLPPFSVHTAKPPEMVTKEKEQPQFKVKVSLRDLSNGELASMECDNAGFFEAMGGAGCGCSLGASPRDLATNAALLLLLLAVPWWGLRLRFSQSDKFYRFEKKQGGRDENT